MSVSTLIPSADLAPSVTSRVLLVRAVDFTEGAPATGSITFELPWDVDVKADGVILKAGKQTLDFDANGEMRIRVPTSDPDTNPDAWFLVVKKSWAPHPYAIRVPVGTTVINLVDVTLVEELPANAAPGFFLTGASVTSVQGAAWDAEVSVAGGIANFMLTFPPGGVAYWRGGTQLGPTANLDTLEPGVYTVWSGSTSVALGLPTGNIGTLENSRFGNGTAGNQIWRPGGLTPSLWIRTRNSSGWTAWERADAKGVDADRWWRGGTQVPATTQAEREALGFGTYSVWSGAIASNLGLPSGSGGVLEIMPYGSTGLQRYTTTGLGTSQQVWVSAKLSQGWQPFYRIDAGAFVPPSDTTDTARPGSGFKVVPLALTVGGGGADAATTGAARIPIRYNAPITRWRVHIRNVNPRYSLPARTGAVSFSGLWLGAHAGNGAYTATPKQIVGPFVTAPEGTDWVSPWLTDAIGGDVERLLSFGYDAPSAPWSLPGGSWRATTPMAAAQVAPAVTRQGSSPFDVWIEAETYAGTPVIATYGDSLSSGVSATLPVYDSTVSQYARARGALPVHYTASGDSMAGFADPDSFKGSRWATLARPDACIFAMGSNDIFSGITLAVAQAAFATAMSFVRKRISENVYLATVMPRNAVTGAQEDVRRAYNTWLRTLPGGARDVFDFAASISTDDETITPAVDADGIHLTTAGYAANAAAIIRPVTTPPVMYQAI